jgi:copper chaperone
MRRSKSSPPPSSGSCEFREERKMTDKTFNVEGMSCAHCKAAVEEELNGLSGVERSNADFERGTVEVRYDESRVTTGDIRNAVQDAGYPLAV